MSRLTILKLIWTLRNLFTRSILATKKSLRWRRKCGMTGWNIAFAWFGVVLFQRGPSLNVLLWLLFFLLCYTSVSRENVLWVSKWIISDARDCLFDGTHHNSEGSYADKDANWASEKQKFHQTVQWMNSQNKFLYYLDFQSPSRVFGAR